MSHQLLSVTFRPMKKADVSLFSYWEKGDRPSPWSRHNFLDSLSNQTCDSAVLEEGGVSAGYFILQIIGEEGYILNIMIQKARRRRGLGTLLMSTIFKRCLKAGVQTLFLDVESSNEPAIELYKKSGFDIIQVRPHGYPDGQGDILMKKEMGSIQ